MTRLSWGLPGERVYESGTDRGVLYVDNEGFAWNGLISVQEKASGGEPTPYYVDGYKYLNIASAEEFTATLEAFSSPPEFAPCDGTVEIMSGLFATQQRRKSFNLSYRTSVGNDVEGTDHGYKIHLVYNALAAPADRSNTTITDRPQPLTLSWQITTKPPKLAGYKPTAHFIVDSRKSDPAMLSALEDILYGTGVTEPDFPTPAELIALFTP